MALALASCLLATSCNDELAGVPQDTYAKKLSISGRIATASGTGIPGVTVSTGTVSTVTDTSGNFRLDSLSPGTVTITPSRAGRLFQPANKDVTLTNRIATGVSFTGSITIEMIPLTGGTFIMGRIIPHPGYSEEDTAHSVTLSAFSIGKYEVTNEQWRDVVGTNPSRFKDADNPVDSVSWYDCVTFCNLLSQREGLTPAYVINGDNTTCNFNANGYRLATEAEWEYACRAGTATDYYNGDLVDQNPSNNRAASYSDSRLNAIGWYNQNSAGSSHPVGGKLPNAFGLYDMSGNVTEWVWDWNASRYSSKPATDPTGPASKAQASLPWRMCRGGSWANVAKAFDCRSSFRISYLPSSTWDGVGFRVVRSIR
ncbi:MAG: SUMF1/EgtB/PvdO family nonheme iron enzyme [Bacteroidetes bacterium]|nr:SUMF1/EgtB/PvdO family nonheme iron enzyme [Bacteroidota bacterium]